MSWWKCLITKKMVVYWGFTKVNIGDVVSLIGCNNIVAIRGVCVTLFNKLWTQVLRRFKSFLAACWRFPMVRTSNNGCYWKYSLLPFIGQPFRKNSSSLTHSFQMHPFSNPWKQKNLVIFWCFRGYRKGALETNRLK